MTSYEDLSQASRAAHTKVANRTRSKKRAASDDAEGPPDKHQDFKKGLHYSNFVHVYMSHNMYNMYVHFLGSV